MAAQRFLYITSHHPVPACRAGGPQSNSPRGSQFRTAAKGASGPAAAFLRCARSRAHSSPRPYGRQQGFTLIELIVTLLVSAIMAIGVVTYLGDAIGSFGASSQRSKLASAGRIAVDRIERELYNAVPNSIRTTDDGQCLEFMPIVAATTYLEPPFDSAVSDLQAIQVPAIAAAAASGDAHYAIIFPVETNALYAGGSPGSLATINNPLLIDHPDEGQTTIPVASHQFERRSPVSRLYLAGSPVSFCVADDKLFRYQDYGLHSEPCTPDTCLPSQLPQRILISAPIDNAGAAAFRADSSTLRRNALVVINLNFSESGDAVRMRHEVMTRNVP